MTTKFNMTKDINGMNGFGLAFSDDIFSATLAANTITSLVVPSNTTMGGVTSSDNAYWLAIFEYTPGSTVYVANNATVAPPFGASFGGTSSDQNPSARYVKGGDSLNFITTQVGISVTVLFYSLS